MDRTIIFVIGTLGAAWFFLSNKGSKTDSTLLPPPPKPVTPPDQNPEGGLLLTDPAVKSAINQQAKRIFADKNRLAEIRNQTGIEGGLFSGINYLSGFQVVIADAIGNPFNIPVTPSEIDPSYNTAWKFVEGLNDFEPMSVNNFEGALQTWKNALTFPSQGFALWPTPEAIEAGQFGPTKKGDRNRSERYNEFTEDAKTFAKNIQKASKTLYQGIETAALQDLKNAGWNIIF